MSKSRASQSSPTGSRPRGRATGQSSPFEGPAPTVHWLTPARQRLRIALAEQLAGAGLEDPHRPLHDHIARVSASLRRAFHRASAVIVRDRLQGYRPCCDLDILLVEVLPPQGTGGEVDPSTHIVKVSGTGYDLGKELTAWRSARPPGLHGDSVLTTLEERLGPGGRIIALVYGDAYAQLGGGQVVSLEEALHGCCLHDAPFLDSIRQGLKRLYGPLDQRFYRQSAPRQLTLDGTGRGPGVRLRVRIHKGLEYWQDGLSNLDDDPDRAEQLRQRREVLAFLSQAHLPFLDPCDYLAALESAGLPTPQVLIGCAHGDLHGRNVLVSLFDNQLGGLAVFDYEKMAQDNLVGWDFVKLETELKVRLYPLLFAADLTSFARAVHDFETALARQTEHINLNGTRDSSVAIPGADQDPRKGRLAEIVLAIRSLAHQHLGLLRHRPNMWLEEYYFLMTAYGVYAGHFSTYLPREKVAAYVAAGTAARRLSRPWFGFDTQLQAARAWAGERLRHVDPPPSAGNVWPLVKKFWQEHGRQRVSYHAELTIAETWARADVGRHRAWVEAGVDLLRSLVEGYPHALDVENELLLALLELGRGADADAVLARIRQRYRVPYEETLCREGSKYKREALELLGDGRDLLPRVRDLLQQSLRYYELAFQVRRYYYPAINVVALRRLLGRDDSSPPRTTDVLELVQRAPVTYAAEPMWLRATAGEALFLQGRTEEAEQAYQEALDHSCCQPRDRDSMRRQLALLERFVRDPVVSSDWAPRRDRLFPPAPKLAAAPQAAPADSIPIGAAPARDRDGTTGADGRARDGARKRAKKPPAVPPPA